MLNLLMPIILTKTAKVVANGDTDVTAQWNIKVNGKTITASPKSTEPLPDGVTYTLQFDIKPTQRAYERLCGEQERWKRWLQRCDW